MGKRSDFEKIPRDFYPTPEDAVRPLIGHIFKSVWFVEPCAGDGRLVNHLEKLLPDSMCLLAMDIEPQVDWVLKGDASLLTSEHVESCEMIITNPPYTWNVLQPLLDRWIPLTQTTLLLPADFMHNKRFAKYLDHCYKIVSIGRVKWIEGSKTAGVDNYCWYFFTPDRVDGTEFKGRK